MRTIPIASPIASTLGKASSFSNYFPSLTTVQTEKLSHLEELLVFWNEKHNLISRKDIVNVVPNHLMPCLAIHAYHSFTAHQNERVIDVGTGGGLPGLPLAILNPNTMFTLLDSNNKKMDAVAMMAKELQLPNVQVVCTRAESHRVSKPYDFVIGRSVSALPLFIARTKHLLASPKLKSQLPTLESSQLSNKEKKKTGILYLKGGDFQQELVDAGVDVSETTMVPVRELIPSLHNNEKFVLYIPSTSLIKSK